MRLSQPFARDYAAMSERVRPVSQVPRTAKAVEPEMATVREEMQAHRFHYMRIIVQRLASRAKLRVPLNRAAQIVWDPWPAPTSGACCATSRAGPPASAKAGSHGDRCRSWRKLPQAAQQALAPGVPGLLRRGRVHERHVGRRGGGDQVVEQQRGPLPGPPVQRGAGEHVVDRVGPRQIAHRQPAQHGGCRARPGSANRWSGFGRSSSSRPRPMASCLPSSSPTSVHCSISSSSSSFTTKRGRYSRTPVTRREDTRLRLVTAVANPTPASGCYGRPAAASTGHPRWVFHVRPFHETEPGGERGRGASSAHARRPPAGRRACGPGARGDLPSPARPRSQP
jgi:hypothetical protein